MLFSVIIPAYNRIDFLPRTLQSVWRQTFKDFEVIVVDDGSTDGTMDFLNSLAHRLTILSQPNKGPGAARNLGANRARGDYLAFLDSDDLWFPWTLAAFATLIRAHNSPAILAGRIVEFAEEPELASARETEPAADVFPDFFSSWRAGYYVGSGTAVLRRDEFLKTGGFTEKRINAEDHDLILRLGAVPGFARVTAPVTLAWRRHAASATGNVRRSAEGSRYLIEQERRGAYPGGASRSRERRAILTKHTRPVALECLRQGLKKEAWQLYRATFRWHTQLGRWKYLAGFPIKALKYFL